MKELFANRDGAMLVELRQLLSDGRYGQLRDRVAAVLKGSDVSAGSADHARLLALQGLALMNLAAYDEALEVVHAALRSIKHSSDNLQIAELQSTAARCLTELGRIHEAEREYRDLIATYRRLDDTIGVMRTLNRLSRIAFIKGQFAKAIDFLLEANDYAQAIGDQKWLAMIAGNLGTILNLSGEFHKAAAHLEESVTLNRALNSNSNVARALMSLAFAQMHLGQLADAAKRLDEAECTLGEIISPSDRISLGQYRAQLALLCGEFAESIKLAESALALANQHSPQGADAAQIGRVLAQAYFESGQMTRAESIARSALVIAQSLGERVESAALRRLLLQIEHEIDSQSHVDEGLDAVVDELKEIGARYELAQSYLVCARSTFNADRSRECRSEASRILRALGIDNAEPSGRKPKTQDGSIPLIGADPEFVALVQHVEMTAESDLPILLLGETGVGKDQIAKWVHQRSPRRKSAFVQVNCGAIPFELAESEFFGHERGAYTNAIETKIGLLEAATGGTLFLNEVGELPLSMQVKLLSALEEKRFYRLGGTVPRRVDFRLIAATNVDLAAAVRQGRFRADLFFRLAVMTVQVPRLAARGEDAFRLFAHFVSSEGLSLSGVDRRTLSLLKERMASYDWPGNVRELKNLVELFCLTERRDPRAVCLRLLGKLSQSPLEITRPVKAESVNLAAQIEEYERTIIHSALDTCGGIIRRAAAHLGLPEATLRSKMKKYRIQAA